MFSVEIKINGRLVTHIYGHNATAFPTDEGLNYYEYELYKVNHGGLTSGSVTHAAEEGIEKLVQLILSKELNNAKAKSQPDLHPRQA